MATIITLHVRHIENALHTEHRSTNIAPTDNAVHRVINHIVGNDGDFQDRTDTTLSLFVFGRKNIIENEKTKEEIQVGMKEVVMFEADADSIMRYFRYFNRVFYNKWVQNYPGGFRSAQPSYRRSGPTKPGNMSEAEYQDFLAQMMARMRSRGF